MSELVQLHPLGQAGVPSVTWAPSPQDRGVPSSLAERRRLRDAPIVRLRRPRGYWDERAKDLIATYDRPDTWSDRNWLRAGAEDETVPRLLREYNCRTVLVPGAGSGRQYAYLAGFNIVGFDISKRLVKECRHRYPNIRTDLGEVVGCEAFGVFDASVVSAVLAHIALDQIEAAVRSLQAATRRLIVVREYVWLREEHLHQRAHDYTALFSDWSEVFREATDERDDARAELIAFAST